jgi:riboflavin kinase/FMN adenylyltransferase
MTLAQKLTAFERAGLDAVAIVRFTPELSRFEPEVFVETVLVDWLRAAEVWVGANFLFGRDRSGTFTLLRALGEDRGYRAEKIEPVFYKDFVVSSTRIRHLVAEGRVDEAGALLGHHYAIEGDVIRGDGRGRLLGCPTANLATDNELLPADGVYATIAALDDTWHRAVTSVGLRPTIGDDRRTVETHLLDGHYDLYGRRLRVLFVKWLRDQARFDTLDALRTQIAEDCEAAVTLFGRMTL